VVGKSQISNLKDPNKIKSPDLKSQISQISENLLTTVENKTDNYAVTVILDAI